MTMLYVKKTMFEHRSVLCSNIDLAMFEHRTDLCLNIGVCYVRT